MYLSTSLVQYNLAKGLARVVKYMNIYKIIFINTHIIIVNYDSRVGLITILGVHLFTILLSVITYYTCIMHQASIILQSSVYKYVHTYMYVYTCI